MIINILSVLWGVPYINTVGLTWAFKPENFFFFHHTKIRSLDYPVTHSVTPFVNFFSSNLSIDCISCLSCLHCRLYSLYQVSRPLKECLGEGFPKTKHLFLRGCSNWGWEDPSAQIDFHTFLDTFSKWKSCPYCVQEGGKVVDSLYQLSKLPTAILAVKAVSRPYQLQKMTHVFAKPNQAAELKHSI